MEINDFSKLVANQFDEQDIAKVGKDCVFAEIASYDSLTRMSIVSSIEDEIGVIIKLEELDNINSMSELFVLVKSKL